LAGYDKQTWINGKDGGTPTNAARFNHMEDGIQAASDAALAAASTDYVDNVVGTSAADGFALVRRTGGGSATFANVDVQNAPTSAQHTTRKDYVDAAIAAAIAGIPSVSSSTTSYPSLGKMRAGLAARQTFPFRIVFAGSSTTAGSNATTTANRYVNRLVTMMQSAYPALSGSETAVVNSTTATLGALSSAGGVHGYNVGESSTTSATYLDATERTNVGAANPRVVLHMIGANDYGNNLDPAVFKANVLTVVNDLKSKIAGPGVQILVHTYARPDVTSPTYNWSLYGAALKQIADADPDNVAFIDISEAYRVSNIAGTDPLNLIDTDLLHQTDEGHALMADLIWQGFGMQPLAASAAASSGSGSVIAADNFDRANSTTLGSTTTGAKPWGTMGTVTAQIVSNTMGVSAATSITGVYVDPAITNYTVQAKLAVLTAGAGNQQGGLLFRGVDANNFWWLSTRKDASTVGYDIYKNVAGVTTRVTTTGTGTPTAGQTVKVVCSGTTYTAYVDGVQIAQVTGDTALSTGTRAGFCFGAAGLGTRWDDLLITVT
jgi:lysophospholipase L1-like esterase